MLFKKVEEDRTLKNVSKIVTQHEEEFADGSISVSDRIDDLSSVDKKKIESIPKREDKGLDWERKIDVSPVEKILNSPKVKNLTDSELEEITYMIDQKYSEEAIREKYPQFFQ